MEMPFGGTFAADDFETGTRAAAWGGTTTIVDFPVQKKGSTLTETLDTWHGKASGKASIDYGFHMIVSDVNDTTLKEMDALVGEGVTSFKMFMAYPGVFYATDDEILRAMQRAAGNGATIMMHAENGIAIDELVRQALAAGHTDPGWHGRTRPPELEGEATARAIRLAQVAGAPLYIVHLSAARRTGRGDRGPGPRRPTCSPRPARSTCTCPRTTWTSPTSREPSTWPPRRCGPGSTGSTSGAGCAATTCPWCPPTTARSASRSRRSWAAATSPRSRTASPGVEHRIDLLHQGVADGELSPARWVEVNSTTPARMFGLYPRKGTIAPGSDADIVIYDPNARHVLSAATHHMAVDYSAYEGREVQGQVKTVLSRGDILIQDGEWRGSAGRGKYLARGTCQYLS